MRTFRFDSNGMPMDAAKYDDTYMLYDFHESDWSVGCCYHLPVDDPVRLFAISYFQHVAFDEGYDYICVFRGQIFPVIDWETRNIFKLKVAHQNAIKKLRCWDFFKRG